MMYFTEEQLRNYARPLSMTEDQKCQNALKMARDALKDVGFTDNSNEISLLYEDTYAYSIRMNNLSSGRNIKMFVQGSYANNTNIRQNSDVDLAIVQEDIFQPNYRYGISGHNYNFYSVPSIQTSFKDEVCLCLIKKFLLSVERKNKSIKVHGNTYRNDLDAVPCRRYRDYQYDFLNDSNNYVGGIVIFPDDGGEIINYPEQHIANGRQKNIATNRYYKKMVRIAKHMKKNMEDSGYSSAKQVSSFGVESLLWNVPDEYFMKYTSYKYIFDDVLNCLSNSYMFSYFKEANGIKPLCQSNEQQYRQFIADLRVFFQYT